MTIRRTDAYREDIMDAHNTARGASAEIQVRSGTNAGTGGQGTLLGQLTGNAGGWGTSSNGVLTSSAITADSSADATGTAGHYQLNTSGSVFLESGLLDVGGTDGVTIDNASITSGQTIQMSGNWVNTAAYDDGV
ncbi:hypothetical protein OAP25_02210 [Flavobacteriaceae bacterium]|nr:hypothetical protein [Flavobacteriaceae bacterium]